MADSMASVATMHVQVHMAGMESAHTIWTSMQYRASTYTVLHVCASVNSGTSATREPWISMVLVRDVDTGKSCSSQRTPPRSDVVSLRFDTG